MADFIITAPDGQKYKVSGENQQGAYAALQESFGGSAPQEQPSGFLENAADIAGAGIAGATGVTHRAHGAVRFLPRESTHSPAP